MRDLNELAVFSAVVRHQSFTKAASALGVPKSTVSRMVARLEERLETRLLARTSRHLSVTDAGRIFHERCAEGLRLLEAAEVVEPIEQAVGSVRVTAMPDFAQRYISSLVGEFAKIHPRIQVELMLTTRLVDLIEERVDLAVRPGPLPDSSLVVRRLGTSGRQLVASPAYLATRGRPRSLRDLARHDLLAYRATEGKLTWRLLTAKGPRNLRLPARLAADDFTVLLEWAVAGLGIALLPAFVCEPAVTSRALVPVLRASVTESVPVFLVHPEGRHLPTRVRLLYDFLVERIEL
jgi:DNA-binding transcriptional LysR family regulator